MVAKKRKNRYTDSKETTVKGAQMMNDMTMGQRIAEQRKMLGLSQEALGEKVGVSRQAISKWESDGAVPEIDKLISLSRLFSVSVGWLLGVEENTPPQSDELTETQLKMVEEIVRRYQPQPEKKRYPWVAVIAILAAALVCIAIVLNPSAPDYSGQISSLEANYRSIQSDLQSLYGRVEDIATAAEEADKVLQSHEFQLVELSAGGMELDEITAVLQPPNDMTADSVVEVDMPTASLIFTAVPKQYVASDKARLVVLLNGRTIGSADCTWQGAGYTAEFSLWIKDGYEYRFVVEHADGTQQIQMLEEYDYCDLAYGTSLQCFTESLGFDYNARTWTFELSACVVRAVKPYLGYYADVQWAEAGLILYRNGAEADRSITPMAEDSWYSPDDELYREYYNFYFDQLKLEEGDELELTFYAALEGGMDMESPIGRWKFTDGKLTTIAEE